jgi:DnaK suppressor protein
LHHDLPRHGRVITGALIGTALFAGSPFPGRSRPMPGPPDDHDVDLDAIRRALETRRDAARGRVSGLAQPPELGSAQGFGKRIGDGTIEAISRLTEIGVGRSLESGLMRTERALAKLDEGTYGICDGCGATIPAGRLRAMPDSVLCVACAASERREAPPRR